MSWPTHAGFDLAWNRKNLSALVVLCLLCGAVLAWRSARRPVRLGQHIPVRRENVQAATEKIDPNTAGAASLRRLPGIGPTIADRIVAYRGARGGRAFRKPDDLMKIKRIGPATVRNIEAHLTFPEPAPDLHTPADGT